MEADMLPAKRIDLLPPDAVKIKRNLRLAIKMVIAQVAIFLFIWIVVIVLRDLNARSQSDSFQLLENILLLRHSPEVSAVLYHQEANRYFYDEAAFFETYTQNMFDPDWLNEVLRFGSITSFEYDGLDIVITGFANNIYEIENLRQHLSESYFFETVGLGNIRSQGESQFFFDLRFTPVYIGYTPY